MGSSSITFNRCLPQSFRPVFLNLSKLKMCMDFNLMRLRITASDIAWLAGKVEVGGGFTFSFQYSYSS